MTERDEVFIRRCCDMIYKMGARKEDHQEFISMLFERINYLISRKDAEKKKI